MVVSVVEAKPVCCKPQAGVNVCISMGERRGFGISVPLSTRASPIYFFRAEGLSVSPKLIQLIGSSSTWVHEIMSQILS